jgi:hypothetical protein
VGHSVGPPAYGPTSSCRPLAALHHYSNKVYPRKWGVVKPPSPRVMSRLAMHPAYGVHSTYMRMMELDALALEYKRDYGTATGNLDIADLVNNPTLFSEYSVLSTGLQEQPFDLAPGQLRSLFNDRANPFLVGLQTSQALLVVVPE